MHTTEISSSEYFTNEKLNIEVQSPSEAAKHIQNNLVAKLEERFGENGIMPKPFHKKEHSLALMTKGLELFDSIAGVEPSYLVGMSVENWEELSEIEQQNLLEEERAYYIALSLGHDIRQDTMLEGTKLVRFRGIDANTTRGANAVMSKALNTLGYDSAVVRGNEDTSSDEIYEEIAHYVYTDGTSVFSNHSRQRVHKDNNSTYPEYEFKPVPGSKNLSTGLRIYQPYLTPESSASAHILAMLDLRLAYGHEQNESALYCGDLEFWEINEVLRNKLEDAKENKNELSMEDKLNTTKLIMQWLDTQSSFIQWQEHEAAKFIKELSSSGISSEIIRIYDKYFFGNDGNNFKRNHVKAENRSVLIKEKILGLQNGASPVSIDNDTFEKLLEHFSFNNLWDQDLSGKHISRDLNK